MFSNRRYSFARAALHGLAVLGLVFAAGASASHAGAAVIPTNDDFATPIKITVASYSQAVTDMTLATTDVNDPPISCDGGGQGEASLWYTFTPARSGEVKVNTTNSGYDTIVAIFMDDPLAPGTLLEMGCNDDVSALIKTSSLTMSLRGGIKYYLEVVRKSGVLPTPPDSLRLSYTFTPKLIAWGTAAGKKWDSGDGGVFAYSAGWQDIPFGGAYKDKIRLSNNVNNTATVYFDGIAFDLIYAWGPQMGTLEVIVDDVSQGILGQGAAAYSYPKTTSYGPFADGVHKLVLKNGAAGPWGPKANFDYIMVYTFPDLIPPDPINDLTATTGTSTGQVTLKWTSVGDDGMVGTATSYEVQYMLNDGINDCSVDWGNTLVAGSINWGLPTPKIAGTAQSATLSGLVPGIDYLFCIAAIDDAGNVGYPLVGDNATPYAGIPIGTGIYDDRAAGWTYVGNWSLVKDPDARYDTLHVSNKVGDYAFFYFTGTQFVLTFKAVPLGGTMDVYIDGVYETTLSMLAPLPAHEQYYTSRMLVPGPHSVRLVHTGLIQVTIDQIYINSPIDGGPPDPIMDLTAVPGINDGEVDLSWTSTGDDTGNNGTATKYEIRYSPDPILTDIDWHFATAAAGVIPAPQPGGNPESVTVVGLTPGAHYYFAVRAFDDANYRVLSIPSGTEDAVATYGGLWSPAGNYDDIDPAWTYNGTWILQPFLATMQALNGTQHISAAYATSAIFHFDGTGFILSYQKKFGLGKLEVYVDGVKRATINQSTQPWGWAQSWDSLAYLGGPLPPSPYLVGNQHVVEFRLVGSKATIDEIEIIP